MVAIWLALMALFRVATSEASASLAVEIIIIRMKIVVITETVQCMTELEAHIFIVSGVRLTKSNNQGGGRNDQVFPREPGRAKHTHSPNNYTIREAVLIENHKGDEGFYQEKSRNV